jgi:ribose transport system substrate-binding protein
VNVKGGFPAAGAQLAAWLANDSGGEAKILWFSADVNPGLVERHEGFHDYLSKFPGIEFEPTDPIVVAEGDVGPKLQQQAVSVLQSHPEGSIDYVYACCDAWTTSIIEAAQSLGRDELKMVSFDGAPQNLAFISQGRNQVADQATPWGWCGWLTMDELNRVMQGEPFVDVGCPSKVLDETNLPPEGEQWDGDIDYKTEFKNLWGVG